MGSGPDRGETRRRERVDQSLRDQGRLRVPSHDWRHGAQGVHSPSYRSLPKGLANLICFSFQDTALRGACLALRASCHISKRGGSELLTRPLCPTRLTVSYDSNRLINRCVAPVEMQTSALNIQSDVQSLDLWVLAGKTPYCVAFSLCGCLPSEV